MRTRTLLAALVSLSGVLLVAASPALAQPRPPPPPPDLPPPPPPPWTSGTGQPPPPPPDMQQPPPDVREPAPPPPQPPATTPGAEHEQNRRIQALEQELAAVRRRERASALGREDADRLAWLKRFEVKGFVQPQLAWSFFDAAASPNAQGGALPPGIGANTVTARPDGTTTNAGMFRLRRARVAIEFAPAEGARFVLEIEPFTSGGPWGGVGTIAREVLASGTIKWAPGITTELAMGIFKVPFGFEVQEHDADRPFIERSWAASNLFPGEFDVGARATTRGGGATLQLALVNGSTLGEKTFALLPDLNKGKDLVGRLSYDFAHLVDFGVSGYVGMGQAVDPVGLRFKEFTRWAFDAELSIHHAFAPTLGQTRLRAELVRGSNMDRGVLYPFAAPSIPLDVTQPVASFDELGYVIRLEQDLTPRFTVGARYDFYTPSSADGNDGRDTFGAVFAWHAMRGITWLAEYAHATDNVHAPGTSAPSRHIDSLSMVLQARF